MTFDDLFGWSEFFYFRLFSHNWIARHLSCFYALPPSSLTLSLSLSLSHLSHLSISLTGRHFKEFKSAQLFFLVRGANPTKTCKKRFSKKQVRRNFSAIFANFCVERNENKNNERISKQFLKDCPTKFVFVAVSFPGFGTGFGISDRFSVEMELHRN